MGPEYRRRALPAGAEGRLSNDTLDLWQQSTKSGARIERHAGSPFRTITDLEFTCRVPGAYLRVTREGREINRSLSSTNFARALASMPVERPSDIKDRQGSAYTWAIVMDERIRESDW